ncbi:hypothetical protein GUJ93_ZPchr0004g38484 [Zizania palustris]|uniref:Uncharacterized protein n=1 Tax=Zizania palustris TaxID=103762 RepID=A0A8J5VNP0_ZIZPA|nr:hypothetical protein GUJ93_ZPchr0004g38484 [Zizania palustris]
MLRPHALEKKNAGDGAGKLKKSLAVPKPPFSCCSRLKEKPVAPDAYLGCRTGTLGSQIALAGYKDYSENKK